MKILRKIVVGFLLASFLLQPLGLVTPVLAEAVNMGYSDPEHIHAPKVVNGVSYKYDANGNLTYDGERSIFWNQDNLPIRLEKDGEVVEFFYDANGRRIVKRSGEDKTIYPSRYLTIKQFNNLTISERYYFANGKRIASRSEQTPTTFIHQDHLGSTVLATNSQSQPTSNSLPYFPYGNTVSKYQSVNVSMNYLFTGQEEDPEINLYNYLARLYNPTTGVFISADPVQGPNRYTYAKDNPIKFTDPTGLRIPGLTRREGLGGWRVRPEDEPSVLGESSQVPSVPQPSAAGSDIKEFLALANSLKEKFPGGLTVELWTPDIRKEIEEKFGVGAAWAIEDSLLLSGGLQCVGLARAYTLQTFGVSLPRFGEGPEKVGIAFESFRWHEGMAEVEVGDIFFYQVREPDGFYNHWAIVSEKGPSGIKLIEAVGAGFTSLGKPAGAVLVNERTFDFASRQITGLTEPLGEGQYGFYRFESKGQ